MKRKAIKTTGIIILSLATLIITIALVISPIVKNYIEKNGKALTGREIRMNDLRINIFTGTLALDSVCMYEDNGGDVFASIDSFYVNIALYKLWSSKIEVSELKVIRPYIQIVQNGDIFNFDDLIPQDDSTAVEDTTTSSFPKSVVIKNILIAGGKLAYTDQQLKNTIVMNDLAVEIPELAFEQGQTDAGVHLKIGEHATLASQLSMDMATNEYKLKLQVGNLPIDIIQPYVKEYFNIGVLEGSIDSKLLITGNMDHLMNFMISGEADASAFRMTNSLDEPVVYADRFSVKMDSIHLASSAYIFDYMEASGVHLDFIMHPETDNISALFKETEQDSLTTAEAPADSIPMTFRVKRLHFTGSDLVYTDKTLHTPFSLPVASISLQAEQFDMDKTNEFKAQASFPNGGTVDAGWKGNINNLADQVLSINLRSLSLPLFSPYCLEYTANDITSGKMNFVSKNNIRNNYITSANDIDIYQMNVGDKHKDLKAEYSNLPLKLGLYILKDKDDKIRFNIPVKGSTDDPEFSYRKIIFQTIANLIVKVAVSPVRFLANSLGLNPDEMAFMETDALQTDLSASQYSHLDKLAEMYAQKPEMTLTLTQFTPMNQAMQNYAIYRIKAAYLDSIHPVIDNEIPAYEATLEIKNNDEDLAAYINGLIAKSGLTISANAPAGEKVMSLYVPDSIRSGLLRQLSLRDQQVSNYLSATGKIPANHLIVKTAPADSLGSYQGKTQYAIEMTLPETVP